MDTTQRQPHEQLSIEYEILDSDEGTVLESMNVKEIPMGKVVTAREVQTIVILDTEKVLSDMPDPNCVKVEEFGYSYDLSGNDGLDKWK